VLCARRGAWRGEVRR